MRKKINISKVALDTLENNNTIVDKIEDADCILVRSAKMHEMELDKNIVAVARAGAGVNNIPLDKYAENGVVVFNTPGANANAVKELVLCGLLLSCRDVVGGIKYIENNTDDENIGTGDDIDDDFPEEEYAVDENELTDEFGDPSDDAFLDEFSSGDDDDSY